MINNFWFYFFLIPVVVGTIILSIPSFYYSSINRPVFEDAVSKCKNINNEDIDGEGYLMHSGNYYKLTRLKKSPPLDYLKSLVISKKEQGFSGLNITIPHKEKVTEICDELSESARILQAVNLITFKNNLS
mgnify:CR=1 FL=1